MSYFGIRSGRSTSRSLDRSENRVKIGEGSSHPRGLIEKYGTEEEWALKETEESDVWRNLNLKENNIVLEEEKVGQKATDDKKSPPPSFLTRVEHHFRNSIEATPQIEIPEVRIDNIPKNKKNPFLAKTNFKRELHRSMDRKTMDLRQDSDRDEMNLSHHDKTFLRHSVKASHMTISLHNQGSNHTKNLQFNDKIRRLFNNTSQFIDVSKLLHNKRT